MSVCVLLEMFQSTPAPKGGRCIDLGFEIPEYKIVSIHTRPEGRAMHDLVYANYGLDGVSIHTRPEGRAMPCDNGGSSVSPAFQSTPAPKGGRCKVRMCGMSSLRGFQSTPAPKGGRCIKSPTNPWNSIGFNPHPPRRAGDASGFTVADWLDRVSIHTRPEGRAMPTGATPVTSSLAFQSTPAPKGGRCNSAINGFAKDACFNPHPPRKAGDALFDDQNNPGELVSIHTRPERRAMLVT